MKENIIEESFEVIRECWEIKSISQVAELIKEVFLPNNRINIPYIGLEHINQQTLSINSIGISKEIQSQKYFFKKGDILFGKLRPYFRKVYKPDFDGVCSTDILVIRAKNNINPDFLFYLLANYDFIKYVSSGSTGTRMPRANWNYIKNFKCYIPLKNIQISLVKVLSALDKKIELNNKINILLEQISKSIFKHWFIDFEFPNENGKPYKSSGGEFIDSELGKIPKDWEIKEYKSMANIFSGKGLPKDKRTSDGKYPIYGANGIISYTNDYLFNEELIITGRVGTLGKIFLVNEKAWISDNVLISRPKDKILTYFIYLLLKKFSLSNLNRGSTQPLITKTDIGKLKIAIPTKEVFINFDKIIRSTQKLIYLLNKQNQTLCQIRDALLPKLITGKIRVNLEGIRES